MKQDHLQRIVVALIGTAIIFLGLNIGLGGIRTLGWQMTRDFISITDATTFAAQDSHVRFIGGVWFGVGTLFLIGGFAMKTLRPTLVALCGIIAVAGLFRLSAMDSDILLGAAIAPSLAFELAGFPLLAWWLTRSGAPIALVNQT